MTFSPEEKKIIKENIIKVRDRLIDLLKDCRQGDSISYNFYSQDPNLGRVGHSLGISVSKGKVKTEVNGFTGGLGMQFDPNEEKRSSSAYAWDWPSYAIEVFQQWNEIYSYFKNQVASLLKTRASLKTLNI